MNLLLRCCKEQQSRKPIGTFFTINSNIPTCLFGTDYITTQTLQLVKLMMDIVTKKFVTMIETFFVAINGDDNNNVTTTDANTKDPPTNNDSTNNNNVNKKENSLDLNKDQATSKL